MCLTASMCMHVCSIYWHINSNRWSVKTGVDRFVLGLRLTPSRLRPFPRLGHKCHDSPIPCILLSLLDHPPLLLHPQRFFLHTCRRQRRRPAPAGRGEKKNGRVVAPTGLLPSAFTSDVSSTSVHIFMYIYRLHNQVRAHTHTNTHTLAYIYEM